MINGFLFIFAIGCSFAHLAYTKDCRYPRSAEVFLSYVLLFNMGMMGLLAAYAHVFMGPETAKMIGWPAGSPFQFEIGMANLSYGVLGVLSYWIRGRFWEACAIGWSVLLIGCMVGHLHDYFVHHNTAPYNIGVAIWFTDLFLPILVLGLLKAVRSQAK